MEKKSGDWRVEYARSRALVMDWAARNGLECTDEADGTMAPEYEAAFVNVTSAPRPDSLGVRMARPTVAALVVRHFRPRPEGPPLVTTVEVHLVRFGRTRGTHAVTADELQRFGLEARHIDRID
jgi:hypothetical protein